MNQKKKIIIIGAGPGGLCAGMILSYRGFDVTIYEKDEQVGGRNKNLKLGDYTFDVGPTFVMMKFIFDEMFEEAGKKLDDYLQMDLLDISYQLRYFNKEVDVYWDKTKLKKELEQKIGMTPEMYDYFFDREKKRFDHIFPCLQKPYHKLKNNFNLDLIKTIPHLSLGHSVFSELGRYIKKEEDRLVFSFQTKYLGMAPWKCPAFFMILSYLEHAFGIYHVQGGLGKISEAMAKVTRENGGVIHLKKPVKSLLFEGKKVIGVELENGEKDYADDTIINADFSWAMTHLAKGKTKKYTPKKLKKKKYSCSMLMLYLGVKKTFDLEHHTVVFSKNYEEYINRINNSGQMYEDLSIYIRNPNKIDSTLAPKGKTALYVLVPAPNNKSGLDWDSIKDEWRDRVLDIMEDRLNMKGLRESIEVEHIITPDDWEADFNVHLGAVFNLSHTLDQMLYLRPRNEFEEFDNCYLVGGGTHPGSSLPTIYESSRISSNLISDKYGIDYETLNKNYPKK